MGVILTCVACGNGMTVRSVCTHPTGCEGVGVVGAYSTSRKCVLVVVANPASCSTKSVYVIAHAICAAELIIT